MPTCYAVRIDVEGTSPSGRSEIVSTTVIVSSEQRAAGLHLAEARFRAGVRGLNSPYRIVGEDNGRCVSPLISTRVRLRPWRQLL